MNGTHSSIASEQKIKSKQVADIEPTKNLLSDQNAIGADTQRQSFNDFCRFLWIQSGRPP